MEYSPNRALGPTLGWKAAVIGVRHAAVQTACCTAGGRRSLSATTAQLVPGMDKFPAAERAPWNMFLDLPSHTAASRILPSRDKTAGTVKKEKVLAKLTKGKATYNMRRIPWMDVNI